MGQSRGELLLEVVLDLRLLVHENVGNVGDYEELARVL